jgi:hypothetical protein
MLWGSRLQLLAWLTALGKQSNIDVDARPMKMMVCDGELFLDVP